MRKLMIMIAATAALALPVAASAHDGWHNHHHMHGLFTKLSGTGTSFAGASATASGTIAAGNPLASGTFAATLTTDWSHSTSKTGEHGTLVCAPGSLALTLTDSASSANTTSSTVTGQTCAFTKSDGTVFRGFFGKGSVTGAGTLSGLTGMERAFLTQKADGTVHGAVFAGLGEVLGARYTAQKTDAAHATGTCDGH
ncbi:MAG TPA: hypothetical protein VNY33_05725 [Gaiellaceae bacterium]|jgi:hypothetical protein|nr:hypothetical protein [Gaiellaceae bacterium]